MAVWAQYGWWWVVCRFVDSTRRKGHSSPSLAFANHAILSNTLHKQISVATLLTQANTARTHWYINTAFYLAS